MHSEHNKTSKMEFFCKNNEQLILVNYFHKNLNLIRCLTSKATFITLLKSPRAYFIKHAKFIKFIAQEKNSKGMFSFSIFHQCRGLVGTSKLYYMKKDF